MMLLIINVSKKKKTFIEQKRNFALKIETVSSKSSLAVKYSIYRRPFHSKIRHRISRIAYTAGHLTEGIRNTFAPFLSAPVIGHSYLAALMENVAVSTCSRSRRGGHVIARPGRSTIERAPLPVKNEPASPETGTQAWPREPSGHAT